MPITSRAFVRSTIALLALGFVALIAIVGTTIFLGERSQAYFDTVMLARDARTATVDLRNTLQLAETSQRGFLLTGDESYLGNFTGFKPSADQQYDMLARILKPYPEADQAVAHLRQAIDQKFAELDQTIELRRQNRTDEALAIVRTNQGKALMDEAQTTFTGLIKAADDALVNGVSEQRTNATWLRWVSIIGGLVIIGVAGGSAFTALQYTRELGQARDEVAVLNQGLEERVNERTADLAQANEEIQRFAYIVTHDLRAPLVNIMGFTSELEESIKSVQALIDKAPVDGDPVMEQARLAATEDLPEAIGFIRNSTKRMDGLINAILKLSREGRRVLKADRVDLKEVLSNAAGALQHQVADANGEVEIAVNVPVISTDRLSIEQIFGNLLDNAVKYRAKDRPLRITIRGTVLPGNRVQVEIEDNGRGIAEQDKERVFELFRRSGTQDQPGEGIGLAFVRAVVRNLGGDITLASTFGKGTTFRVVLPRQLQTQRSAAA